MAEKDQEVKGGIFGGKGSLKEGLRDVSGDKRVTFADTWLGDLLGFDGDFGVQGAGLRESWFGARRDGPGSKANKPNMSDAGTGGPRRGGPRRDLEISLEEISESGSGMNLPEYPEESQGGRVRYRRAESEGGPTRYRRAESTGGPTRYRNVKPDVPSEAPDDLTIPEIDDEVNAPSMLEVTRDRIGDTGRSIPPFMARPYGEREESPDTVKFKVERVFRKDNDLSVDEKVSELIGKVGSLTKDRLEELIKEVSKLPDSFDKKSVLARLKTLKGVAK